MSESMQEGPALDERVARLMGDGPIDPPVIVGIPGHLQSLRWKSHDTLYAEPLAYSTDIAAAWLVVEWMDAKGWKVDVQNRCGDWACHVNFPAPNHARVFERAPTAAHAICLAALAALDNL